MHDNVINNSLGEALTINGNATALSFTNNTADAGVYGIDFCMSITDADQNNVVIGQNMVSGNMFINCGLSAIAVDPYGGTGGDYFYNVFSNNTFLATAADASSDNPCGGHWPDIWLNGSFVTNTTINGNTSLNGLSNNSYNVQECNTSLLSTTNGYPVSTQVGTLFGGGGASGFNQLFGAGSVGLSGGSTGR